MVIATLNYREVPCLTPAAVFHSYLAAVCRASDLEGLLQC